MHLEITPSFFSFYWSKLKTRNEGKELGVMTNAIGVAETAIANRPAASDTPQVPSQASSASVQMQQPTQPCPPSAWCLAGYARWEAFSRRRRQRRWEVGCFFGQLATNNSGEESYSTTNLKEKQRHLKWHGPRPPTRRCVARRTQRTKGGRERETGLPLQSTWIREIGKANQIGAR